METSSGPQCDLGKTHPHTSDQELAAVHSNEPTSEAAFTDFSVFLAAHQLLELSAKSSRDRSPPPVSSVPNGLIRPPSTHALKPRSTSHKILPKSRRNLFKTATFQDHRSNSSEQSSSLDGAVAKSSDPQALCKENGYSSAESVNNASLLLGNDRIEMTKHSGSGSELENATCTPNATTTSQALGTPDPSLPEPPPLSKELQPPASSEEGMETGDARPSDGGARLSPHSGDGLPSPCSVAGGMAEEEEEDEWSGKQQLTFSKCISTASNCSTVYLNAQRV